jgi:hypothetical protein
MKPTDQVVTSLSRCHLHPFWAPLPRLIEPREQSPFIDFIGTDGFGVPWRIYACPETRPDEAQYKFSL